MDCWITFLNIMVTQVTYSAVLLFCISKGRLRCLGLQFWHLLHGSASWPLPVSMMTDCYCGGEPTNILT